MKKTKKKSRKKAWIITVIALFIVLSASGGTFLFVYAIARKSPEPQIYLNEKTEHNSNMEWTQSMAIPEKMSLTTVDGTTLTGYYFPSDRPSKKLAVLVHCRNASAARMKKYAEIYYEDNFNVFIADNRGHGQSGGKYIGMGWLDRLDYLEWLEILIARLGDDCEIVLHGLSMGGATVMMMSGEENLPKQVKCIVEDCGYTSVAEEYHYQLTQRLHLPSFPVLNIGSVESKILAGYSFYEASALDQIGKAEVPILFIHGSADTFVPTSMVYELYAEKSGEKELWVVNGAGHVNAYSTNPDEYIAKVRGFYCKYIDR